MPENTLELGAVHDLEQAGRDRHGRVLRVAPGSECVQRRIVNHIDTRIRETDADAELLNHVMKLLKLVRIRFPSPGSRDCEPVRIEVARPDQADRNEEGDKDEEGPELEEQVEGYDRSRDEDREPDHQIHSPALVRADLRHQVSALGHVTSSQIVFRTRAGPPSLPTRSRGIGVNGARMLGRLWRCPRLQGEVDIPGLAGEQVDAPRAAPLDAANSLSSDSGRGAST